jgi:hypothetical protein
MATADRMSGRIIQASWHVGRRNGNDGTFAILRRQLTDKGRVQLIKDLSYAPAWIVGNLRRLGAGGAKQVMT